MKTIPYNFIILFILNIDTISLGLSILYLKVSQVKISKICVSVPEDCFYHRKQR